MIKDRYDIIYLFDVLDGNINGDPDMDNRPREDQESGNGIASDVCLKRKIRDYVAALGIDIFFKNGIVLNDIIEDAHKKVPKDILDKTMSAREYLIKKYYDIRTFGAVLTTGKNAGQVRGPVQVSFSRTIDPILVENHTIVRKSVTDRKEADDQIKKNGQIVGTMGRKHTVPYALYRTLITVTPLFSMDTGFDKKDLSTLLNTLVNMWDIDRSSSRGIVSTRGLYVFEHQCPTDSKFSLGRDRLIRSVERIKVSKKEDVEYPRSFDDYVVDVNKEGLPSGLKLYDILSGEGKDLL